MDFIALDSARETVCLRRVLFLFFFLGNFHCSENNTGGSIIVLGLGSRHWNHNKIEMWIEEL